MLQKSIGDYIISYLSSCYWVSEVNYHSLNMDAGLGKDLEKIQKLKDQLGGFVEKIEQLSSMTENEQKKFIESISGHLQEQSLLKNNVVILFCILIILFTFVFFGYKLYKSLVEKERRREEKRKMKQMKKKK